MICYQKSKISLGKKETIIKANSKYIISIDQQKINIFTLKNNKIEKVCDKSFDFKAQKLEMNKIYNNIFLTISHGLINIFEITEKENNYELENKLRIETKDSVEFAKFSEYNEKIVGAVSNYNIMRLWNIDSNFNFITINLKCQFVEDFFFNQDKNLLMIQCNYKDDLYEIYIYDISYGINLKKEIKRKSKDFIYEKSDKNFEKIIFINQENIEYMDVINNRIYDKFELNLENEIDYICFYKNIQLLFLFTEDSIKVIDIENKKILFLKNNDNSTNIFADFCLKENKKLCINLLSRSYIEKFTLEFIKECNSISPHKESNNLFARKFKKVFTKSNLDFSFAEIKKDDLKKKSYLEIEEIKKALHNNYSLSLEAKRQNVDNTIIDYKINDTPKNKYIFLLKLLIQDNTNKKLLVLYLEFLRDNKNFLMKEFPKFENFDKEFSKYKVAFTSDEIVNFGYEKISEKNEFSNFLNKILKIETKNDFDKIIGICENSNLGIFNQRIEYDNQELFWFRNKQLIIYALLKMNFDKIKLMKSCINKIMEKKLFKNQVILNDYKYITLLMFLIVVPLSDINCIENLNLIESVVQENTESIMVNERKILNSKNQVKIINYKQAYNAFNNVIKIEKIKNFLKRIFFSNVIKEAFQILYPSYINFPFQTEKDVENYIDNHINFVVFYSNESNGITDKFTLDTFIFLKQKNIMIRNIEESQVIEIIEKILYTGGIIKTNLHELNHNFYNMFYCHENGNIPLKTPRKNGLKDREGGREMEILLFGSILQNINLKQALYILNENNYKKNIFQFKEDFEKLYFLEEKKEDYTITGEFAEYNLPDKFLKENTQFFTNISLEDSDKNIYVESFDSDGLFGEGSIFH